MIAGTLKTVWGSERKACVNQETATHRFTLLQGQNKFSILEMEVVNSNNEFIIVDASINGRIQDGDVLSYTELDKHFRINCF